MLRANYDVVGWLARARRWQQINEYFHTLNYYELGVAQDTGFGSDRYATPSSVRA